MARMSRAVLRGLICALLAVTGAAHAQRIEGVVTRVSDGDTVWLRPAATAEAPRPRPIKLRLIGIDAPERCQAGGTEATAALKARVLRRTVVVDRRANDDYGRGLVVLHVDGDDVNAWLVVQGHAWNYAGRSGAGRYASQERQARAAGRGVFADPQALEPRRFRRRHGPCDAPRSGVGVKTAVD